MQVLILAGGSGTRFWPLSRRRRPKQLLALDGPRSLLQATLDRLAETVAADRVWVCTTSLLAEAVRDQLPEVPASQVLSEPEGRNTAAAIGWAVRSMPAAARDDVVAVLPADHRVADPATFQRVLKSASEAVRRHDRIVTLGITPHRAETGYGYLELGETLDGEEELRRVRRFCEKPDPVTAEAFLAGGRHLWNAGIFVFRGTTFLRLLERHQPELAAGLEAIAAAPERLAELYGELPAVSIDYGLMEKLDDIVTLPLACGWSDLGSWQALAEALPADDDGNVRRGDVLALDSSDNLLVAEQGTVAVLGVEGLAVITTGDAVLVLPRERSQEVRELIAELRSRDRSELL